MTPFRFIFPVLFLFTFIQTSAEDGYRLWLRYDPIENSSIKRQYLSQINGICFWNSSSIIDVAEQELSLGLKGLLDIDIVKENHLTKNCILIGSASGSPKIKQLLASMNISLTEDGYTIKTVKVDGINVKLIAGGSDKGVLYGIFTFLRLLQMQRDIQSLDIISNPRLQRRILDHWDNLNRSIERGYAGISIFNWHTLPDYRNQRYIDYARANASIGINGTVLTNVNANSLMLTNAYLKKVKALADLFRNYGIQVYLTAKFTAPIEIGGLKTADPLNKNVQQWWKQKCDEIYSLIPDFGGFLIKANSEGQPGPQGYGRSHADGANMFADALAPHGGIVMWRAFVYDVRVQKHDEHFEDGITTEAGNTIASNDRFKQAYDEFKPLDGKFKKNVLLQVKNGPIDFQPREPFSPLFGAMPQTPLMMEFQITQEYLGQATHLVYEAPLFKEVLEAETYASGPGSTVANIISGNLDKHSISGIAGVANIGNEINWTGHPFAQANWYAFGRLAWDYTLSSEKIAEEWLQQTFSNNPTFIDAAKKIMCSSRETLVNYMTPMGLHHIMGTGHHYGPAPWVNNAGRADWNPIYYHKADSAGLGFNRTTTGSNALAQYLSDVQKQWAEMKTCDENYIFWFHHVPWSHKMKSGRNMWEELCFAYNTGVDSVRWMQNEWKKLASYIDKERFNQVSMLLNIQLKEAIWWRDACLLYFQTLSQMPIPKQYRQPEHSLEYYKSLKFPFAPGIGGNL